MMERLVDIDEVLDNLELREAADEQVTKHTHTNNTNIASSSNGSKKLGNAKNFVGVSQVFTDLDDYRKNVETLETTVQPKYDADCRLPIASSTNAESQSPPIVDAPTSSYTNTPGPSYKANPEDDDDDEASNDIQKFTENANSSGNTLDYDDQDTSDSLTTSSSSTFSSGPSERLSPVSDESKPSHVLAPHTVSISQINHTEDDLPEEEQSGAALEDLATGLSSISITSSMNSQSVLREPTVSSVLNNVLNELSEQTSNFPSSQHREEASGEASSTEDKVVDTGKGVSEQQLEGHGVSNENDAKQLNEDPPNPVDTNLSNALFAPIAPQQQQPITFGSTMDEISDTELDSMLQEMDIDGDADVDDNTQTANQQVFSRTELAVAIVDEENETHVHELQEECEDRDIAEEAEALTADSFSQASTVEFSEIRAQNIALAAAQTEEMAPNYTNSYTSSDSSSLEDDQELQDGTVNGACIGEDDANITRPQRPTTLDLPALKMNLYTNAGQTPPGNCAPEHEEAAPNSGNDATNGVLDEVNPTQEVAEASGYSDPNENLGRVPPIWVPDNMAAGCMQCQTKFTMIKRRHHCRACGKVLCSVCCSQKFKLEFINEPESRVCVQCYLILMQRQQTGGALTNATVANAVERVGVVAPTTPTRSPNPNNPMEYCSTIPPHRQVSADASTLPPPSVIVPVGVLKKDGSHSSNSSNSSSKQGRKRKSVMFSDGIAPGSDLAGMEQHQWGEAKHARRAQQSGSRGGINKPSTPVKADAYSDATTLGLVAQLFRGSIPPTAAASTLCAAQGNHGSKSQKSCTGGSPAKVSKPNAGSSRSRRLPPSGSDEAGCFIPPGTNALPPIYVTKDETGCDFDYKDVANNFELMERLQRETLKFAVTRNFFVYVKILNLKCCLNRIVINYTTSGYNHVGNDEVVVLLEFEPPESKELMTEPPLPKDIFVHLYEIYREAELGNPISELSYTCPRQEQFLGSRNYGGFIFIRPTFQCVQEVILPPNPFLIGILIHRSEVPWAKVFPLRLMLRLGAQYRYYPCPHISMRQRESVYADIAQTIINFLADFRNYSYTLPNIRGMYIHMEDRQTTVLIPRNRQEDIIKAMNNSSDHILAFGGNFSKAADGHLVCMQNTNDERTEKYSYSTQAINIQGQPRKVTGASFFVLNESLKTTSGLSGKCSIVEDGLMVQILPTKMEEVRSALANTRDIDIVCGPVNAEAQQTEVVSIKWTDNDKDFNIGVKSPIDDKPLEGVSSMRVHASFNYANANYSIRLTEIFVLKFEEWYNTSQTTAAASSGDITRIAEQVARSASLALVPFLDLLAASGNHKVGLRVTLHMDSVCYEAGARGCKLPPLYMNALDNHLIPTLHNESANVEDEIILELIFYILNV